MATFTEFDDIRPYNDQEVRPTLERLLHDNEFIDTIAKLKLPKGGKFMAAAMRPVVRKALRKEVEGVTDVHSFQMRVKNYMQKMLDDTTAALSVSGLDSLERKNAYCFISNHRDITLDPAFVNWVLFHNDFKTLRIAIGDNLLTKPFASDLMRLNKSFIVNRSATGPREKLKAAKKLSAYIHHSVAQESANIWLAQREGRAKDGKDKTNPAILSMLSLAKAKPQPLSEYLAAMPIVPIAISYEFDPCDVAKARELTTLEQTGTYQKAEQEDVQSIATGIKGDKGRIHLAFGDPITHADTMEEVVEQLDMAIWKNYVLHATNCLAYEMLEKKSPKVKIGEQQTAFLDWDDDNLRSQFRERVNTCDEKWRDWLLKIYANPVYTQLALQQDTQ